eukprot:scaffold224624_cov36-Prasinocladus_malaysianus.AAC.1
MMMEDSTSACRWHSTFVPITCIDIDVSKCARLVDDSKEGTDMMHHCRACVYFACSVSSALSPRGDANGTTAPLRHVAIV